MPPETKTCQSCKQNFTIDADDFAFYEKISVPAPTWCPWCRMVRRMAFWNERSFFRVTDSTGKTVLSTYPQESILKIIDKDVWFSDAFDGTSYGRDYDFSKPFFTQYKELLEAVPVPHRSGSNLVNSEYSNNADHLKNCYMCFNSNTCENCMYTVFGSKMKDSIDTNNMGDSVQCYDCDTGNDCNKVFFGCEIDSSYNSWLLYDCDNVSDCFGCVGQRGKKYCIFNVEYSKEDYSKKLEGMNIGSYAALEGHKKRWRELMLTFPRKYYSGIQNTNVIGENVCHAKNAKYCYKGCSLENIAYSQALAPSVKDSYDYTNWGINSELIYETVDSGNNLHNVKFSYGIVNSRDTEYCLLSINLKDCFGCTSLRGKQYCILNKQYTKEEYEALVANIKQQMVDMPYVDARGRTFTYGEFFPSELSPFAANETALPETAGMSKEDMINFGLLWREPKAPEYKITSKAIDLPDHISQSSEEITKEIIECIDCKKAYRITPVEFAFLKENGIPLPRKCYNCRFKDRVAFHNIPKWYDGHCQKPGCPNTFVTTYAPERLEVIYCESCYQQEVV